VDGVEVIAKQDDATLPPGKVYLSASGTPILFDDFRVWTPDTQPPPMLATPPTPPATEPVIEVTAEVTPEATTEVTPEATAEVTPEATAEVMSLPDTSQKQEAQTYIVNSKADNYGEVGPCDATHCTLREAITEANANPGMDTIEFNIPAESAPFAIGVISCQLPPLTDPVIIDGYTQPTASVATSSVPATLKIEIVGVNAFGAGVAACPAVPDGLRIEVGGSGSIIRGLSITRFKGNGIHILGAN